MSHIYDEHETIAVLRAVVAIKGPEYVYERPRGVGYVCVYWDRERNCPSCLVGHVLAHLGFPPPPAEIEGARLAGIIHGGFQPPPAEAGKGSNVDAFVAYFLEKFTHPAIRVLMYAQDAQDDDVSWGAALRRAEQAYAMWTQEYDWPSLDVGDGE